MGGGGGHGKELDATPTWAVAAVCAVIVIISIALEKVLHHFQHYFKEKRKKALSEALEKVKGELMVLGFISLLLTFGQNYIANICIPSRLSNTMLPCARHHHEAEAGGHGEESGASEHGGESSDHRRRLLSLSHRMLSADATAGCHHGYDPLISVHGLHQLHIFIFFLAVFHVIYSAITMTLGRLKIRGWKDWETEIASKEVSHDSMKTKFRLTHETSFVRENTGFCTNTPVLFFIACFWRQFFRSVRRSDYLTMRHAFITVHLSPGTKFDFQKYIKRSLEDDFKVVVGISPLLWASAVFFLLVNVHGWESMTWLSIIPPAVILAVGTKLQAIIARMAVEITERHAVIQGMPVVQVSDNYFWFAWPQLVLYMIHFVLFQNAFEITYFFWIWYEFGLRSCFHYNFGLTIFRVCLGVGVQVMCSYITLPLYALVTQMGSTMKRSIFDEHTSKALKAWHMNVKKKKLGGGEDGEVPLHAGEDGEAASTPGGEH